MIGPQFKLYEVRKFIVLQSYSNSPTLILQLSEKLLRKLVFKCTEKNSRKTPTFSFSVVSLLTHKWKMNRATSTLK